MKTRTKVVGWIFTVLLVAGAMTFGLNWFSKNFLGSSSSSHSSSIVQAIERTEEVALLGVSIQGITETEQTREVFGWSLPGSGRATFIMHTFTAKLGIDGADVDIKEVGDNRYQVSIPAFTFIGHDDISFSLATEDKGVISWVTPEIDPLDVVNDVMNDQSKLELIDMNWDALKDQAEVFYTSIISAVDPDVQLDFVHAESPTQAK